MPVRFHLRWLGWLAVALITLGFILLHRHEWGAMDDAARQARLTFLLLAAALQVCWLVCFAAAFWGGLAAAGVRLPFTRTLALSWSCHFINMVVKSGGMSGMAVFLRAAVAHGYAGTRTMLGYLLTIALGYIEFLLLLAAALALLWLGGDLRRLELVAAVCTFTFLLALIGSLIVVVQSPARIERTYRRLANAANRVARLLRRCRVLDPAGGTRAAREADDVMRLVRGQPARLLPAAIAILAKELSAVAVMYAVLLAFDVPAALPLAFTAYALTILFSYVSIIPSGLGLVEISLTALLVRVDVPPAEAALATAVYRLFQFWVPFFVGAIATRFVGGSGRHAGSVNSG